MEHAYVITGGGKRLERFNALFSAAGFDPLPAPWHECRLAGSGAIGCSVAHYSLVRHALEAGIPRLVVFEDDAVPCDGAKASLESALSAVPPDCLFLQFGWTESKGPVQTEEIGDRKAPFSCLGSHAYALFGKEAYEEYLSAWEKDSVADHVADYMAGAKKTKGNLFCQYNSEKGVHNDERSWTYRNRASESSPPPGFSMSEKIIGADTPMLVAYTVDFDGGAGASQFSDQLYVSVKSLRDSRAAGDLVDVAICYYRIPAELMDRVRRLESAGFSVRFEKIPAQEMESLQAFTKYRSTGASARMWSGIVFARLFLARVFGKLGRCIYLDADTLVRTSVRPLWETDLGGKAMGLAMGVVPEYGYNSGVILMDLSRIRSLPDVWARLRDHMEKYAKTYFLPDQTVINRFFAGEIAELPQAWNFPPTPGNRDPAAARAAVWHFYNQQIKPYRIGNDDVGATLLEWNRVLTSGPR